MHHAVQDDRLWFHRHPKEVVRFRVSAKGEFAPLTQHGETPPAFRPSCSRTGAPLQWVAVVDLMQLLGTNTEVPNDHGVRLRLQTPAIPLAEHRLAAKQELMKAVAAELLMQVREADLKDQNQPDEQSTADEARESKAA
jgi:hypothetical protein